LVGQSKNPIQLNRRRITSYQAEVSILIA